MGNSSKHTHTHTHTGTVGNPKSGDGSQNPCQTMTTVGQANCEIVRLTNLKWCHFLTLKSAVHLGVSGPPWVAHEFLSKGIEVVLSIGQK